MWMPPGRLLLRTTRTHASAAGGLTQLHPEPHGLPCRFALHPLDLRSLQWLQASYDDLILDLQRRAYEAALALVASRKTVIQKVAAELCENRCAV